MKKYLLLPAALALCACNVGPFKSAEFKTYEKFAQAYATGNCDALLALSEGAAREAADKFCAPGPSMTIMGQTIKNPSAASMVYDLASTPAGASRRFHRDLKSRTKDGDAVRLTVVETVMVGFKPEPGGPVRRKQVVRLVKSGGQWKITDYEDTQLQ